MLRRSTSGLPATANLNTAKAKPTLPIFWLQMQTEDREKASEARQQPIHEIHQKRLSGKNSFSFLHQSHSYNFPHATNCLQAALNASRPARSGLISGWSPYRCNPLQTPGRDLLRQRLNFTASASLHCARNIPVSLHTC